MYGQRGRATKRVGFAHQSIVNHDGILSKVKVLVNKVNSNKMLDAELND